MFIIINAGVCCHYQIEGGVFTDEVLANAFADGLVNKYTKREDLKVVPVPTDPALTDFERDSIGCLQTSVWWP